MNHFSDKILIIDCQTTGMHPNNSFIVQLGWSIIDKANSVTSIIEKRILQSPEEFTLSSKIKKILNLDETQLNQALAPQSVIEEFNDLIKSLGSTFCLIHYAPFELRFLKHYFNKYLTNAFPNFPVICTQKLTKLLLPNLPNYSLKALTGHFGLASKPCNEVISHVQATLDLWQYLKPLIISKGLICFEQINEWITDKPFIKPTFYDYKIERLTRLSFPDKPGIYKMIAKDDEILYIGKASSLKNRINSYFRGLKNRDKRVLEMLTQVHRIDAKTCDSIVEAELLESDLIKQYWPPYNIALKNEEACLIFYNRDFVQSDPSVNSTFYQGPYKVTNHLQSLFDLYEHLLLKQAFVPISNSFNELYQGWQIFCQKNKLLINLQVQVSRRQLLVISHLLLQQIETQTGKYQFEVWWRQQKSSNPLSKEVSVENLAEKIWRLFIRAAIEHRRSKAISRLSCSKIKIQATNRYLELSFTDWNIEWYDKFSILLTAKRKKLVCSVLN